MQKITLEMDKPEALAVLGAVEDSALSWSLQAAISTGLEKEYALLRSRSLKEQARRIVDALYPDPDGQIAVQA